MTGAITPGGRLAGGETKTSGTSQQDDASRRSLYPVAMPIAAPARQVGRSLLSWDSDGFDPITALRAAGAVAVAIAVSQAAGQPGWGAALVLGAWCSGITLISPDTRTRPSLPLSAGVALAAAAWLGGMAAPLPALAVAVAALWALLMSWIGSLGGTAGVTATVSGVLLVLAPLVTDHASPYEAAVAVAAGAGLQSLAALLPPWTRRRPERQLLADAFRAVAVDAYALADAMNTPLSTKALLTVRDALSGRRKLPRSMRELTGQLYELRAAVVAAAAARARLLETDPTAARHTAAVLRNSAVSLDLLANSVQKGRSPAGLWEARLAEAVDAAPDSGSARHAAAGAEVRRLHRALHQAARLVERIASGEDATAAVSRRVRARSRLAEDWQQLRANATWESPTARHALRATVAIAVTTAAGWFWPGEHGYWLPLTAWLVLRPDFAGTIQRGIGRTLGTAAGVAAASLLATALPVGSTGAAAGVALFAMLGYLTLPVSYVVYSAALAGFTVFQIDLAGQSAAAAALERGLATLTGGMSAVLIYTAWPTWQSHRLADLLADLVDAYRDYARLILRSQADPDRRDPTAIRRAVDRVRLQRKILSAAAEAAASEPIAGPPSGTEVLDVEAALSRARRGDGRGFRGGGPLRRDRRPRIRAHGAEAAPGVRQARTRFRHGPAGARRGSRRGRPGFGAAPSAAGLGVGHSGRSAVRRPHPRGRLGPGPVVAAAARLVRSSRRGRSGSAPSRSQLSEISRLSVSAHRRSVVPSTRGRRAGDEASMLRRMSEWMDAGVESYLTSLAEMEHDDPVLRDMERHAAENGFPIVGRAVGRYLEMSARAVGARRVVEQGSGYGYSAYWFARAVGPEGKVICTDGDPANAELAREHLTRAGLWDRIEFLTGDALECLEAQSGEFDVVYNDVDKHGYPAVWKAARERIRLGGLYICDNVIWSGRVVDGSDRPGLTGWTAPIIEHNRLVAADERYTGSLIPLRDGVMTALRTS